MLHTNKQPHGSALLTALFIMTLVAIVATAMSTRLQIDIYRVKLITNHDKLYHASQAVGLWALNELSNGKQKFTQLLSPGVVGQFPTKMSSIYPSVTLSGTLYDLQALYNLNNLVNKKASLGFANMLGKTVSDIPSSEKLSMILALNDWVSSYDLGMGKDNYLSYYLHQKPPYQPSRQLMSSPSELRLIKDVSAKSYLELEPWVTALPEPTPININTASKKVLLALNNTMDENKAEELIEARGEKGITNLEKISELMKKFNIINDQITLESAYFLSVAHASSDNSNLTVYTLLKRKRDKKGKLSTSILWETFNTL